MNKNLILALKIFFSVFARQNVMLTFLRPTRDWFRAIWPPKTTTLIRLHRVVKNDDDAGARWFMILTYKISPDAA